MSLVAANDRMRAVGQLVDACARSRKYSSDAQIREAAMRLENEAFETYGRSRQYYEPEIAKRVEEVRLSPLPPIAHQEGHLAFSSPDEFPQDPEFLGRSERYHTWMFSTYHSSLKNLLVKEHSLKQLPIWGESTSRMVKMLGHYLANPLRLPVTRQQLADMVFIRGEVSRLISAFKDKQQKGSAQVNSQATTTSESAEQAPNREESSPIRSGGRNGKTPQDAIPSISPRRRLEEYVRSMEGVLSLLRPSVARAAAAREDAAPVKIETAVEGPTAAAVGKVPVGELIAELREHLCGIASLVMPHGPPTYMLAPTDSSVPPASKGQVDWNSPVTVRRISSAVTACFRGMKWASTSLGGGALPSTTCGRRNWLALCGDLLKRCDFLLDELQQGLRAMDSPHLCCAARRRCGSTYWCMKAASTTLTLQEYSFGKRAYEAGVGLDSNENGGDEKRHRLLSERPVVQKLPAVPPDMSSIINRLRNRFTEILFIGCSAPCSNAGNNQRLHSVRAECPDRDDCLTVFFDSQSLAPVFALVSLRLPHPSNIPGSTDVGASSFEVRALMASTDSLCEGISTSINRRLWCLQRSWSSKDTDVMLSGLEDIIEFYKSYTGTGLHNIS